MLRAIQRSSVLPRLISCRAISSSLPCLNKSSSPSSSTPSPSSSSAEQPKKATPVLDPTLAALPGREAKPDQFRDILAPEVKFQSPSAQEMMEEEEDLSAPEEPSEQGEYGYRYKGPEPTLHNDWAFKGRVTDF